jgi:hypothetical protein
MFDETSDADPLIEKRDVFDYEPIIKEFDTRFYKSLLGFAIYIAVFVVLLPLFLLRGNYTTLLEAYLPNVDMVATVLSFVGGPGLIWRDLYVPTPYTQAQFYYQTFCNFLALCGLTYLVSRETFISKSISKGWSIAFVMILTTYLLPSQFISKYLEQGYEKVQSKYASVILGAGLIAVIVGIERILLLFSRQYLSGLASSLVGFGKSLYV